MASVKYTKIPEPALHNLTRDDLIVLDLALAYIKDREKTAPNTVLATESQHVALDRLHMCVLEIKRGEAQEQD